MARISNKEAYITDEQISGLDYFIGTDSDDNNKTVNFQIKELGGHYNLVNGVRSFDYLFYFHPGPSAKPAKGTFYSNSNTRDPNEVEYFIFSALTNSSKSVSSFFESISLENPFDLKVAQKIDLNTVFYFKIDSVETFNGYYKLNVSKSYAPNDYLLEYNLSQAIFEIKADGLSQNNTWRQFYLGQYNIEDGQPALDALFNQELIVSDTENILLIWSSASYEFNISTSETIVSNVTFYRYKFARGKGIYDTIPNVEGEDIIFESVSGPTIGDIITIINGANTQTYNIGDTTGDTLEDSINISGPYDLTNEDLTYYFLHVDDGITKLYLFIGELGNYGLDETEIEESDLQFVASSSQIASAFNLQINEEGDTPISNVNRVEFANASVEDLVSGAV